MAIRAKSAKIRKLVKLNKHKGACAVAALTYASKQAVEVVESMCKLHGFETDRGMIDEEWREAAEALGLKTRRIGFDPESPLTLSKFVKQYNEGLYFVSTKTHLFIVHNGLAVDTLDNKKPSPRRLISEAWIVVE